MEKFESDIPKKFRGDQILIVAEMDDGEPIVASGIIEPELLIGEPPNQVRFSELPVLAKIEGISEEASDRIAHIVESYHPKTGTAAIKINRAMLLQALIGGEQN